MFVFHTNGSCRSAIKRGRLNRVIFLIVTGAFLFLFPSSAFGYDVPPLPDDNLITNPWFRSASDPGMAGLDGWTNILQDGVGWDISQKESNPSPEIVVSGVCGFKEVFCGTGARWANENVNQQLYSYPGVDAVMYQVVQADPTQRKLKFFMYWVNHKLEVFEVKIYSAVSTDGPWTEIWDPFYLTQDINPPPGEAPGRGNTPWFDTGFMEAVFPQGSPYYKIEFHARYGEANTNQGDVGVKVTGVYLSTEKTDAPADTALPTIVLNGTWAPDGGTTTQPQTLPTTNPSPKPERTRIPTATSAIPTPTRVRPTTTATPVQPSTEVPAPSATAVRASPTPVTESPGSSLPILEMTLAFFAGILLTILGVAFAWRRRQ